MCVRVFDCTTFVRKPTKIDYIDGHFHVETELSENAVMRLVYAPAVFMQSLLSAEQAMAAWQAEQQGEAINVHQLYPVEKLSA